ncbi:hypothetical protein An07g07890 [Aspergillus niger]|uniref:Uncharacterized protein n=2 Tax=Aspergillus niger TaxID=5061 RepID=A5AAZ0_ASPNC|nr:hypothetical protein An07g07890 [Aspergillus niger]CAK39605.1 hypothetical protein An07g07890 [Aspergillus niger]
MKIVVQYTFTQQIIMTYPGKCGGRVQCEYMATFSNDVDQDLVNTEYSTTATSSIMLLLNTTTLSTQTLQTLW